MAGLFQSLHWTFPSLPFTTSYIASLTLLILSEVNAFYPGSVGFKIAASTSFLLAGVAAASSKVNFLDFQQLQAPENRLPVLLVLGLAFSWLGDYLLIPSSRVYYANGAAIEGDEAKKKDENTFKLGVLAFALAHIAYGVGFFSEAGIVQTRWNQFSASLMVCMFILHLLGPLQTEHDPSAFISFPKDMQALGMGYTCIIVMMVATATSTDKGTQRIAGAWLFMVSDIFVAWDCFGKKNTSTTAETSVKRGKGKKDKGARVQQQAREGWLPRSIGWVLYFTAQMLLAGSI